MAAISTSEDVNPQPSTESDRTQESGEQCGAAGGSSDPNLPLPTESSSSSNTPHEIPLLVPESTVGDNTTAQGPKTAVFDVMIDLETLSTGPDAHILTFGAIKFRRDATTLPLEEMDTFYRRISFASNDDIQAHKSSETICWWVKQSAEARREAFASEERVPLADALREFAEWFGDTKSDRTECNSTKSGRTKCIWSHGSSFDITIITEAFRKCKINPPFEFWMVRDTRTAYDLFNVKLRDFIDTKRAHHALYDCYHQIQALRSCFRRAKRLYL